MLLNLPINCYVLKEQLFQDKYKELKLKVQYKNGRFANNVNIANFS